VLIRRARPGDIEPALAVMAEGFGLPIKAPSVHTEVADQLLVAEEDGVILGTAATAAFGTTGWLGGIVVAPSARGRGLGGELTRAALEALGRRSTVLLLASPLGRPIYDRLGFVPDGAYRVFISDTVGVPSGRLMVPERAVVAEVDRCVTFEDRSPALDVCSYLGFGGAVALRPPWRALPIVGEPADAEVLLRELIEPGMRLAVPEQNARAVAVLSALATEREGVVRMRLGPPLPWRPERVWGVFSLFFG
jgi:predicted N-acetyltransferase YhbS